MSDPLDPNKVKLERRTLRMANELFLRLLHAQRAQADYNPEDDFARSIEEAYRVIRERKANGGPGWTPP